MNDFKCNDCGTEFRTHRYISMMHPSRARCPKCKGRATRTEEGKAMMKSINYYRNQSLKRRGQ